MTLDGGSPDVERRPDRVVLEPDVDWDPLVWLSEPDAAADLRAELPLSFERGRLGAPALRGEVVVTASLG